MEPKGKGNAQKVEGAFFRGGSTIFRAVNFELFAKGNKNFAMLGSFMLLCSVGIVASIEPKGSKQGGKTGSKEIGRIGR